MVLNRRTLGHVLVALAALGAGLAGGCKQSLFDNRGPIDGGGGGGGDGAVDSAIVAPPLCPSPCLADAAADFNGTPGGAGDRWRYLDDHRDRTWLAMTGDATTRTGADPGNRITTCAANPSNPACVALPGALLVASAGATAPADPAIELTFATSQAVQLTLHALVASGADQQIRLYRNSREDVLFTGTATAGTALDHALVLDAVAGDRFLVAVAPSAAGAEVAIQLFASSTGARFPSTCQLALSFAAAAGNTVDNLCGTDLTHRLYDADMDTPPPLGAGPYPELGTAADLTADAFFEGTSILDKTRDTTVQLWVKHRGFAGSTAWLFSDLDLNNAGGLGIALLDNAAPVLDIVTTLTATPTSNTFLDLMTPYPADGAWHFVRVVHSGGSLAVCLDGVKKTSAPVAAGFLGSTFVPFLAKNVRWSPQGAFVNGQLDDVRAISSALPCD